MALEPPAARMPRPARSGPAALPRFPILPVVGLLVLSLTLGCLVAGPRALAEDPAGLSWDKREHDFGVVGQNEDLEAVFTFTNSGTSDVSGLSAQPDCGCYGLEMSDTVLGPGESGTLRVRFRTLTFIGPLVKHAKIQYTDTTRRTLKLALKMSVEAGILLQPGRAWFGEVVEGSLPQEEIHVKYKAGRVTPFRIKSVELPPGQFAAITPAPYVDPRDSTWKGWTLALRFVRPPPKGVYSRQAIIRTDHADYPEIRVSLTATVVGKVWVQTQRLTAGLVAAGDTREMRTMIRPARGSGVTLGAVSARSRKGVLQARLEPVAGRPEHYTLIVTVPATAKPGRLDDVVEILTEVPGERVTEVKVIGRVFKKIG